MTDETQQEIVMTGDGNQPEGTGYAAPDTGDGENAPSEIPVGVDSVEAKDPPEDAGEGGAATIDLANLDIGDADADAGDDEAEATGDADAEATGDADADAEPAGEAADPS
jgi:hypothetical protein